MKGVQLAGRTGVYDITLHHGDISVIAKSKQQGGGLITPLLADIHVHLDKTYTIERINARENHRVDSLFDAIDLMQDDRSLWSEQDIYDRASRGLNAAYQQGVGAMRTHIDWVTPEVPEAWAVLVGLREEWKSRIDLQLAALIHGDIVLEAGDAIGPRVARDRGVLGCFFYRNADLEAKVEAMFQLALKYDLALDFHVDEGLQIEADGLSLIIAATMRHQLQGRVLCGHACSLSLRSDAELQHILSQGADAGIGLVSLPTSNLYLQDRLGGKSPRLRGIAPLKEARHAGISVMLASDNVGDAFYPYGDYDPLAILRLAATVCHLPPADWLDAITSLPAQWCNSAFVSPVEAGREANFIWHDASDINDLISRPQARRVVYRAGQPLQPLASGATHDWRKT